MTRNGKIARLPRALRDQLNQRLDNGEQGGPLLEWLNGRPEVGEVLARDFCGVPINKQNLSDWKAGGYREWLVRQDALAQARESATDAGDVSAATDGRLADHLSTVLAARYASLLADWDCASSPEFAQRLKDLRGLCQDIMELRRGDHSGARLEIERQRVAHDQERLDREREKTDEEVLAQFERWAETPVLRQCLNDVTLSREERSHRIREIFGPSRPNPTPAQ